MAITLEEITKFKCIKFQNQLKFKSFTFKANVLDRIGVVNLN